MRKIIPEPKKEIIQDKNSWYWDKEWPKDWEWKWHDDLTTSDWLEEYTSESWPEFDPRYDASIHVSRCHWCHRSFDPSWYWDETWPTGFCTDTNCQAIIALIYGEEVTKRG
jgi:hypothetical protein